MKASIRRTDNSALRILRVQPAGILLSLFLSVTACRGNHENFEDEVVDSLQKIISAVEDAGEHSNLVFADGAGEQHALGFDLSMQAAQMELMILLQKDASQRQLNCQIWEQDHVMQEGCRL